MQMGCLVLFTKDKIRVKPLRQRNLVECIMSGETTYLLQNTDLKLKGEN